MQVAIICLFQILYAYGFLIVNTVASLPSFPINDTMLDRRKLLSEGCLCLRPWRNELGPELVCSSWVVYWCTVYHSAL